MRTPCVSWIALTLVLSGCFAEDGPPPPPPLEIQPGAFNPANQCGECHTDIYRIWSTSMHAYAYTSMTFQTSLKQVNDPVVTEKVCMKCHAPLAAETGQPADSEAAREGVGCDYCHSIRGVTVGETAVNVDLEIGGLKYGPIENVDSMGHGAAHSVLHRSSEVCAGCHEYTTASGLKVLTTYSEWKTSGLEKDGKTCQRCHMPLALMRVVDPRVRREPHSFVNLHQMPGGHNRDQLHKALELRFLELVRRGDRLDIKIRVNNKGAAHRVPTGLPSRAIILTLAVEGSGTRQEQTRLYGMVVRDNRGQELRRDADVILRGVRIESDTRLAPGESRNEAFSFKVNPVENLNIKAALTYRHAPLGASDGLQVAFMEKTMQSVVNWPVK